METLSSVIKTLVDRGYDIDFNLPSALDELATNYNDYRIEKTYRFEGMTNPEDAAILYSIVSISNQKKGILVNGYGISSNEAVNKVLEKLK